MAMDLSYSDRVFTLEEIKRVIFNLGGDKAPGRDGFLMKFFKKSWETVKGALLKLCEDFNAGSVNLERIN